MISKKQALIKELKRSSQPVLIADEGDYDWGALIAENLLIKQEAHNKFEASEGVEILRGVLKDLYMKPISSSLKLFVIGSTELLKREQANTLLKLLEEPPVYLKVVLITKNLSKVIDTIKSRSKIIIMPKTNLPYDRENSFINLLSGSFKNYSDEIGKLERGDFTRLLLNGIEEVKKIMLNKTGLDVLKKISVAISKVENTNVNYKLVAEELFIYFKSRRVL
ncbi:MAG: hypothetical protein ABH810_00975 [bacterium]